MSEMNDICILPITDELEENNPYHLLNIVMIGKYIYFGYQTTKGDTDPLMRTLVHTLSEVRSFVK